MKMKHCFLGLPMLAILLASCAQGGSSSSHTGHQPHTGGGDTSVNTSTGDSSSSTSTGGSSASSTSGGSSTSTTYTSTTATDPSKLAAITDIVQNGYNYDYYYSDISSSIKGSELKSKLATKISGHAICSYDDLEAYMRQTDRDWSRSPSVTDENPYMTLLYYTANGNNSKQQLWNHYHTSETKFGIPEAQQSWDKEHI